MTRAVWWALWPSVLMLSAFLALWLGVTGATVPDVINALTGSTEAQAGIIATHRLPRAAAAVVVGINLGLAGAILQIVFRNGLADPTIFGISGGASLAVVIALSASIALAPPGEVISVAGDYLPLGLVPPIAMAGALCATAIVIAMSYDRQLGRISPQRMLLMGVVTGAILTASVMALVLALADSRTELAILWLSGSLYARGWQHVAPVVPFTLLGVTALALLRPTLSAMRFDPQTAASLGVNARRDTPLLIAVAVALAASAVSVAGPVGFVGLLAPHIARRVGGEALASQLWASGFIGAILVVAGDTIGRVIIAPNEMPVGIMTSLIGAPVFAILLSRSLRRGHGS